MLTETEVLQELAKAFPATAGKSLEEAVAWLVDDHTRLKIMVQKQRARESMSRWVTGEQMSEISELLRASAASTPAAVEQFPHMKEHFEQWASQRERLADAFDDADYGLLLVDGPTI